MPPTQFRPTRRQVLAGTTAGAVAAMSGGLGSGLTRIVEEAYAATPTKHAPLSDIEHVVFLMMENRSFDHYFGTFPGVRGFNDPKALPGVFKQKGFTPGVGPDKNGYVRPFHLNTTDLGQFYHVAVDSRKPYRVYGGLQDNGSWGGPSHVLRGTGPVNDDWLFLNGGDGFVCRVDPTDPDLVYFESQNGFMGRRNLRTGERAAFGAQPVKKGEPLRFNWNTPFILSNHNPGIVYCSTSGYGQTGPKSQWAGHDINYLAAGGYLDCSGRTGDGGPALPGATVADSAAGGMHAVMSILAALVARQATGAGQ